MRIAILLAVMLAMSGPASAVVGDLNRDGVVDLKDFLMLADNFGLEGTHSGSALFFCPEVPSIVFAGSWKCLESPP